jgi:hypothetical protein
MATYKSIKYIIPVEAVEHTDSINALNDVDTVSTAPADGQILKWNNTNSKWYPGDVEESASGTQKALFGFGHHNGGTVITNVVSSAGVVAADVNAAGTYRGDLAASSYGGDKAIFGFGRTNVTNLVSSSGVVSIDQTGVGTVREELAAASFGGDKAIFGFGMYMGNYSNINVNITNLVSNVGVVSSDTSGVGVIRVFLEAAGYGGDKAIFAFGSNNNGANVSSLVSNTGVVASDTTGVGTAKDDLAAAGYGGDKAIFGFGSSGAYSNNVVSTTNLVSNLGVVATDTTGVGTARTNLAASGYGVDKAIFGFGEIQNGSNTNVTNLVSNVGVVSSDQTGVGQARGGLSAAGFSSTA